MTLFVKGVAFSFILCTRLNVSFYICSLNLLIPEDCKMSERKEYLDVKFCGHCSKDLKRRTYYTHRQKYYNKVTMRWKTVTELNREKFARFYPKRSASHSNSEVRSMDANSQTSENGAKTETYMKEDHENESQAQKFSWEATIIGVLKKATDNEISVKKLKKKVLAEYNAKRGDGKTKSEEELFPKLNKKINKNPRLKVLKDRVKLIP